MPERERLDLVEHLRLLLDEEAPLWEAPLEATIVTVDGSIKDGPWSAELCASVLVRWIQSGLVGLYRYGTGSDSVVDLSRDEALTVAEDVSQWRPDSCDVFLCLTDRGASVSDDVWRQVAGPVG